ncbi:MAG: porin family protein [Rickettsiales bacterium]|nr:porin family protein [Rickettsiales bacterium]
MKRLILLASLLAIGGRTVQAHGLYLGAGYGVAGTPSMKLYRGACPANYVGWNYGPGEDDCYYDPAQDLGFDEIYGDVDGGGTWPTYVEGDWVYDNDYPDDGPIAWYPGDAETNILHPTGTSSFSLAVGWDFPKSPFRVELEYYKTSFKSESWDLEITSDENTYFYPDAPNIGSSVVEANYTSTMLNVLFEIPLLDDVDPYIGFGIGQGKLDFNSGSGGSNNLMVHQLIAGIEYRFPDTPYIVGVEYRKIDLPSIAERDNKEMPWYGLDWDDAEGFFPTMDSWVYMDYSHSQVMVKVRYDFISNDY